jgi:pullulanase/glycogen debranching enzyme
LAASRELKQMVKALHNAGIEVWSSRHGNLL